MNLSFCGRFSPGLGTAESDAFVGRVRPVITRNPKAAVSSHIDGGFAMVWASPEPETEAPGLWLLTTEAVSAASAGEPATREALLRGEPEAFAALKGTYCGVSYRDGVCRLFTDHLGICPLYYARSGAEVVFSTSLRVLQHLLHGGLSPDFDGILARSAFGFELGEATSFAEIRCLGPGEFATLSAAGWESGRHYRLPAADERAPWSGSMDDAAEALRATFLAAVERRRERSGRELGLVSSGMDSRLIAAALIELGVVPTLINFGAPDSYDTVLSRLFADHAGCPFRNVLMDVNSAESKGGISHMIQDALVESGALAGGAEPQECPLWSGDGGSVVFGHVYMTPDMVPASAADVGRVSGAYLAHNALFVPIRLFAPRWRRPPLSDRLRTLVAREIGAHAERNLSRAVHYFLVANDQHRHLWPYFEDIDRLDYRLKLPFYDRDFVDAVLRTDIELCLLHRVYDRVFRSFAHAAATPWQTYRGHVPCEMDVPAGAVRQWDVRARGQDRAMFRRRAVEVLSLLARLRGGSGVLSGRELSLAALSTLLGLHGREYLVMAAAPILGGLTRCGHRAGG